MRSLLDANFLISLLDTDHAFHERAQTWFAAHRKDGWASCPLTENAFVRIMANPGYSQHKRYSPRFLIDLLNEVISKTDHCFWPDEISLLDFAVFNSTEIRGPKQLTDVYLSGLATRNRGRLVTFDGRISMSAVPGSDLSNMIVL